MPIHWAISNQQDAILELLMQEKSFDPDVKDGSGWTPLMIASSLKEGEGLVNMLLAKGADVNAKSMYYLICTRLARYTCPCVQHAACPKFQSPAPER